MVFLKRKNRKYFIFTLILSSFFIGLPLLDLDGETFTLTELTSVYTNTPPLVDSLAPYWDNLIENTDPIDLGDIIIIYIDVSDISGVSFVYLEYNGLNHTMTLESGDTYIFMDWKPIKSSVKNYIIWMSDIYDNINSTSGSISVLNENTSPEPKPSNIDPSLLALRLTLIIVCVSFWIIFSLCLFVYISYRKTDYTNRERKYKNRFKTFKNKAKNTFKKQKKLNKKMVKKKKVRKNAFDKKRRR